MPKLTMTWDGEAADWPAPKRGDRLGFPRRTYMILHVREMKRRGWKVGRRFQIWCFSIDQVDEELKQRLYRSACRRSGSLLFPCVWNSRKKKAPSAL